MEEDEIQPLNVTPSKTLIYPVCQNLKQASGSDQNRYFYLGQVFNKKIDIKYNR